MKNTFQERSDNFNILKEYKDTREQLRNYNLQLRAEIHEMQKKNSSCASSTVKDKSEYKNCYPDATNIVSNTSNSPKKFDLVYKRLLQRCSLQQQQPQQEPADPYTYHQKLKEYTEQFKEQHDQPSYSNIAVQQTDQNEQMRQQLQQQMINDRLSIERSKLKQNQFKQFLKQRNEEERHKAIEQRKQLNQLYQKQLEINSQPSQEKRSKSKSKDNKNNKVDSSTRIEEKAAQKVVNVVDDKLTLLRMEIEEAKAHEKQLYDNLPLKIGKVTSQNIDDQIGEQFQQIELKASHQLEQSIKIYKEQETKNQIERNSELLSKYREFEIKPVEQQQQHENLKEYQDILELIAEQRDQVLQKRIQDLEKQLEESKMQDQEQMMQQKCLDKTINKLQAQFLESQQGSEQSLQASALIQEQPEKPAQHQEEQDFYIVDNTSKPVIHRLDENNNSQVLQNSAAEKLKRKREQLKLGQSLKSQVHSEENVNKKQNVITTDLLQQSIETRVNDNKYTNINNNEVIKPVSKNPVEIPKSSVEIQQPTSLENILNRSFSNSRQRPHSPQECKSINIDGQEYDVDFLKQLIRKQNDDLTNSDQQQRRINTINERQTTNTEKTSKDVPRLENTYEAQNSAEQASKPINRDLTSQITQKSDILSKIRNNYQKPEVTVQEEQEAIKASVSPKKRKIITAESDLVQNTHKKQLQIINQIEQIQPQTVAQDTKIQTQLISVQSDSKLNVDLPSKTLHSQARNKMNVTAKHQTPELQPVNNELPKMEDIVQKQPNQENQQKTIQIETKAVNETQSQQEIQQKQEQHTKLDAGTSKKKSVKFVDQQNDKALAGNAGNVIMEQQPQQVNKTVERPDNEVAKPQLNLADLQTTNQHISGQVSSRKRPQPAKKVEIKQTGIFNKRNEEVNTLFQNMPKPNNNVIQQQQQAQIQQQKLFEEQQQRLIQEKIKLEQFHLLQKQKQEREQQEIQVKQVSQLQQQTVQQAQVQQIPIINQKQSTNFQVMIPEIQNTAQKSRQVLSIDQSTATNRLNAPSQHRQTNASNLVVTQPYMSERYKDMLKQTFKDSVTFSDENPLISNIQVLFQTNPDKMK